MSGNRLYHAMAIVTMNVKCKGMLARIMSPGGGSLFGYRNYQVPGFLGYVREAVK